MSIIGPDFGRFSLMNSSTSLCRTQNQAWRRFFNDMLSEACPPGKEAAVLLPRHEHSIVAFEDWGQHQGRTRNEKGSHLCIETTRSVADDTALRCVRRYSRYLVEEIQSMKYHTDSEVEYIRYIIHRTVFPSATTCLNNLRLLRTCNTAANHPYWHAQICTH